MLDHVGIPEAGIATGALALLGLAAGGLAGLVRFWGMLVAKDRTGSAAKAVRRRSAAFGLVALVTAVVSGALALVGTIVFAVVL
ncbi:hypothetical protein OG455_08710 [Kitasatospora sp. NBC_01287]|uniref:hypothetical protein n=1 Tax=Kitasatospora sp. NBC_01287 TaxID=2903573 RepID=UPI00224CD396|nr:hypothetical protein [Kitasatospora sp. NBC_01287]MCX4745601.1 hypothetical protein [Kitasatospora sp. NBC_01287]